MNSNMNRGFVVTGGSSGIGLDVVRQAAAAGHPVAFCGVESREQVNVLSPGLLELKNALYMQVDVRNEDQMQEFYRDVSGFMGGTVTRPEQLVLVASAGVSLRGDKDKVQIMRDINVGGTRRFFDIFRKDLGPKDCVIGFGSIVAAENISVEGDNDYRITKAEIIELMRQISYCQAFAVAPGAIDSPMTRKELIFPMLAIALGRFLGQNPGHPLAAGLATYLNIQNLPDTPAAIVESMLQNASAEKARRLLGNPRYALLKDNKLLAVLSKGIKESEEGFVNVINALKALDIIIEPSVVAGGILAQLDKGEPEGRLLRIYSQYPHAETPPIVSLMSALAAAA